MTREKRHLPPQYVFAPLGALFFGIGLYVLFPILTLVGKAERAPGVVVEVVRVGGRKATFAPRVEFTDSRGARHAFQGSVSSAPSVYSTGERVEVLYDPERPERAEINFWVDLYLLPGAILLLGSGILVACAVTLRKTRERLAHKPGS